MTPTADTNPALDPDHRILDGLGVSPGATELAPRFGPCDEAKLKQVRAGVVFVQEGSGAMFA